MCHQRCSSVLRYIIIAWVQRGGMMSGVLRCRWCWFRSAGVQWLPPASGVWCVGLDTVGVLCLSDISHAHWRRMKARKGRARQSRPTLSATFGSESGRFWGKCLCTAQFYGCYLKVSANSIRAAGPEWILVSWRCCLAAASRSAAACASSSPVTVIHLNKKGE